MHEESFITTLWKLALVLGLAFLNGFFVAAEFAFVKLRDTQLEPLILKGHRRAKVARHIAGNLEACLSATQLGITLCSLALGAIAAPVFEGLLAPIFTVLKVQSELTRHTTAIVVGFLIDAILLVVIGELAPKALAIRKTLPVALATARPMDWFCRLTFPFIWVLNHAASWLLKQIGIRPLEQGEGTHSEEELRLLFTSSQQRSGGTKLGRDIVLNALDLRRRIVRQVMRPRQEIIALNTTASIAECLELAEKTRYSRFPLCENGDLDRTLGVVHFKDLFAARHRAKSGTDLIAVARKLIYVPETARLERLLQLFLERKLHLAIVVDEYGGTVGMVTLENILEELVGQIQDEFDQEKPLLISTGDRAWEVAGNLPLHELEELVGEPLSAEGITTTSGWVTQRLGGFPKEGDILTVGQCQLRVLEMDGPRIARLELTRATEEKKRLPGAEL